MLNRLVVKTVLYCTLRIQYCSDNQTVSCKRKQWTHDVRGKPLISSDRWHKTPGADNRPLPSSSYCLNVQDTMQDTAQIVAKC